MAEFSLTLLLFGSLVGWQSYTNTNFVNDLAGDDSVLVLATRGGVVLVDPEGPRVRHTIVNSDGLPSNLCLVVSRDDSGNIWVGTDGGGLAVLPRDSTRATAYRPNDLPDHVSALVWDGYRLLVGSDRGLYVVESNGTPLEFDDDAVVRYSVVTTPELLSDRILSLGVHDGYWVGTNLGISSVDTAFDTWSAYRSPFGDSAKAVGVWRDSLLLLTERGVAVKRDTSFDPVYEFADRRIAFDLQTTDIEIYVATDTGVYVSDAADSTRFQLTLTGDARSIRVGETVWVGLGGSRYRGSGLRYKRTGQSWSSFYNGSIASALVASCAFSPADGRAYACHYASFKGLSSVDPEDGALRTRGGVTSNPNQVACDSKGRVWFGHFSWSGGLSVYDPAEDTWGTVKWGSGSNWNIIDAFGIDQYDTKWVYNGGNVIVAIDSVGEEVEFDVPGLVPPPGGGYDFAFSSDGTAWLGLTVGLVMVDYAGTLHDPSDDTYEVLSSGLPTNEVRSLAVDMDDNVWAGTPQGVGVWDGQTFRKYTAENSALLSSNVYRVRGDASGRMWFLCDDGLSMFDPVSGRWTNYTSQSSGLMVNTEGVTGFYTSIDIDLERGYLAIGSQRGLSIVGFGADSVSDDAASLVVYPNPCILGVHELVVVDSLPEDATVEVRTLSGQLVATPSVDQGLHRVAWRPGDIASGLYLIVVHGPKGVHSERVAIVRQ